MISIDGGTPNDIDDGCTPNDIDDGGTPNDIDDGCPPNDIDDGGTPNDIDDGCTPNDIDYGCSRSAFLIFKCLHGSAPRYLSDYCVDGCTPYRSTRSSLRSAPNSRNVGLIVPRTRTKTIGGTPNGYLPCVARYLEFAP